MNTEQIKDFITTLTEGIEKSNLEMYIKIIESHEIKEFSTPEEFHVAVLYQWDKFIRGLLKQALNANKDVEFIYKNYRYIEMHLINLFQRYEGSFACADKTRTVINSLVEFYTIGNKIEFNYEGEYTYHLPRKILTTHEEIIGYFEGLRGVYYGYPQKYLEELQAIIKK